MTKQILYILVTVFLFFTSFTVSAQYEKDTLGGGFLKRTIEMIPDYEGDVVTTLVRKTSGLGSTNAVLYIHGFNDYFFQKETADFFNEHNYNFYAVDLRKYGRSYLPHQKRGNVRNLKEYFADIDSALYYIRKEGNHSVILLGHSTGGLIASLYLDQLDRTKEDSSFITGLILNSPFFNINSGWFTKNISVPSVATLGKLFPKMKISLSEDSAYGKSLHKKYKGEWDYDLSWKPIKSIPINAGWIRAIYLGQSKLRRGLHITQPVLVMHSSHSVKGKSWTKEHMSGDAVLNVDDIHKYSPRLGNNVEIVVIQDGMHDLALSAENVRSDYYKTITEWVKKNIKTPDF